MWRFQAGGGCTGRIQLNSNQAGATYYSSWSATELRARAERLSARSGLKITNLIFYWFCR
jgi:hypothetical protein